MGLGLGLPLCCLARNPTLRTEGLWYNWETAMTMVTSLPPHHRKRPFLSPRSYELCWALEEGSRNTPGYACLTVS